jgi:hypothetical protein
LSLPEDVSNEDLPTCLPHDHVFNKANTFSAHHPTVLQQLPDFIIASLPFRYCDGADGGTIVSSSWLKLIRELALRGSISEVAKVASDVHHQMYHQNELERCLLQLKTYVEVGTLPWLVLIVELYLL